VFESRLYSVHLSQETTTLSHQHLLSLTLELCDIIYVTGINSKPSQ